MRIMLQYQNGLRAEAVLLAINGDRMRIIIGSDRETTEMNRVGEGWSTEAGEPIEIDALLPIPGVDVSKLCAEVYPRTSVAGRSRSGF